MPVKEVTPIQPETLSIIGTPVPLHFPIDIRGVIVNHSEPPMSPNRYRTVVVKIVAMGFIQRSEMGFAETILEPLFLDEEAGYFTPFSSKYMTIDQSIAHMKASQVQVTTK